MFEKSKVGAKVRVDLNAQSFPSSYNGIPESTHYCAERFASGRFVTGIERTYCKGSRANELTLTEEQKKDIADFVEQKF